MGEIEIGKGDFLNSAMNIFKHDGIYRISRNDNSYWIYGGPLDMYLRVMKNTEEGKLITCYLNETSPKGLPLDQDVCQRELDENLTLMMLKHIPVELFNEKIDKIKAAAKREGKEELRKAFKELLDIQE